MYGMTEGGLVCRNHPNPNEMIEIDKKKAIASTIIQKNNICIRYFPINVPIIITGRVFGSVGKVVPNCKLKV